MTTAFVLIYFLGAFVVSVALWSWALQIGLRWVGRPTSSYWRCVGLAAVVQIAGMACELGLAAIPGVAPLTLLATSVFTGAGIPIAVIAMAYRLQPLRAAGAWLTTLPVSLLLFAAIQFVAKPFFIETYAVPTNSMAPTVVGHCQVGVCPECGSPAYNSPPQGLSQGATSLLAICERFHTIELAEPPASERHGDRIIALKRLRPRRWDLVVHKTPWQPETVYLKRLVGLPGETITIIEGDIHINGKRIAVPERLTGLEYVTTIPGGPGRDLSIRWGSAEIPATLRDDEYFVLGDFSSRALDSRLWEQGALGSPPYAVPGSYLIGVATHTYWPMDRWRCFR